MSNDHHSPKVIAYFAHSTILHILLTALDAILDPIQLKWYTFHELSDRKFKSSKNAPFAANLAIVKYRCAEENTKIGFFLNEKPLQLDWCDREQPHICTLESLQKKFEGFRNCEETFCRNQ